jgi:hypothetical protein
MVTRRVAHARAIEPLNLPLFTSIKLAAREA